MRLALILGSAGYKQGVPRRPAMPSSEVTATPSSSTKLRAQVPGGDGQPKLLAGDRNQPQDSLLQPSFLKSLFLWKLLCKMLFCEL